LPTPRIVLAQADAASAQARSAAIDAIFDSFMDYVSLNHQMNAGDNGLNGIRFQLIEMLEALLELVAGK